MNDVNYSWIYTYVYIYIVRFCKTYTSCLLCVLYVSILLWFLGFPPLTETARKAMEHVYGNAVASAGGFSALPRSIQWREYRGPDSQWMTWMTDARRWSLLLWQIREWLPSILWWWFYCQEGNNGAFLSYLEILEEQHWRSCFTGGLRSNDHVHNFRNAFGWCCSRLSVDVKLWDKMTSIGSDQGGAVLDYSEFTQPDPKSCV